MALLNFNLTTIGELDGGRIAAAFEHALARITHDLRDRPGEGSKRTLTLEITVSPLMDEHGELSSAQVQAVVKDKIPARRTKTYDMKATKKGLHFNELSPEDHRQLTIDDAGGPQATTEQTPETQPQSRKNVS